MSIRIEYGCTYDCFAEQVCHNSGPYTDDECHHNYSETDKLVEHIKRTKSDEIKESKRKRKECLEKFQPEFDAKVADYLAKNVDECLLLSSEQYHTGNYGLWLPQHILDQEPPSYTIAFDRNDNVFLVRYNLAFALKYCKWVYIFE